MSQVKDTKFQKGKSPNPGGKPKGRPRRIRKDARYPMTMTQALQVIRDEYSKRRGLDEEGEPERGLPYKLIKKLLDDALEGGDPRRIEMLWERFDGAVTKEIKIHAEVQTTVQAYLELAEPVINEWFTGLIASQVSAITNLLSKHGFSFERDSLIDKGDLVAALSCFPDDVYPKGSPERWLHKKLILAWADHEDAMRTQHVH